MKKSKARAISTVSLPADEKSNRKNRNGYPRAGLGNEMPGKPGDDQHRGQIGKPNSRPKDPGVSGKEVAHCDSPLPLTPSVTNTTPTSVAEAAEFSLRKPSEAERDAIFTARQKNEARTARVRSGIRNGPSGPVMSNPHSDGLGWEIQLRNALGTSSKEFVDWCITQIVNVFHTKDGVNVTELDAILAVLDGAEPKNEIEAMLIVQAAITHALVMRSARSMAKSKEIPQQDSNGLALFRLSKTFTAQIEAFSKLRRDGSQKVTVEHVHVYPGGQAIVGNVTQAPSPGGILENTGQPYAANDPRTLALATEPAVRCQDPEREALPVANRARQEAVPDARRGAWLGCAEGASERHVPARLLHGRGHGRTGVGQKMDA